MGISNQLVPVVNIIHDQKEVADRVDTFFNYADNARIGARIVAGAQAFRKYDALSNAIGLNQVGNLRGMVVSQRWRTIFNVVEKSDRSLTRLGAVAALVAGLIEAAPEIELTLESRDSALVKGLKITTLAGTISERMLLGVLPFGTHLIYKSLEGWLMLGGLMGGRAGRASAQGISILENADTLVQTTFTTWTDTQTQGEALWRVVNVITSRKR